MDGKDILKTLVELLEEQEQIKVTYVIKDKEEIDEHNTLPTSEKCS